MNLLQKQGYKIQPYKVGPDYVDTEYHTRITGKHSRNLDMFLVPNTDCLRSLFEKEAHQADICVIEGVMGLFDGLGVDKDYCSSAGIAKLLNCPVLLVVDGQSASTSVAAVVKGFANFDPEVNICGVLINKVASETHYQLIRKAVEKYTDIPVFGYLKREKGAKLPSRQLGLIPDRESKDATQKIQKISESLEKTFDFKRLVESLPEAELSYKAPKYPHYPKITLAYALDEAFHFYYQDNFELLSEYGVELISFSPIRDHELPSADLYYFGGGYPEEFAEQLAENSSMRQSIKDKHEQEAFILAECGGLMYLGSSFKSGNEFYPMVGIFEGVSEMSSGLRKFGYCYGEIERETLIGKKGTVVVGHEFHHSVFNSQEPTVLKMTKKRDGEVIKEWAGGYQKKNTFGSYLHLHFYQNESFLQNLLQQVRNDL